jgi:tetratricopeptide (TPR) repeat protein
MLDRVVAKTRKALKEQEDEINRYSQQAALVITGNYEALQHYMKGENLRHRKRYADAEYEYRKAIELDSTFGLAYYKLAMIVRRLTHAEQHVQQFLDKALGMIGKIPEKERYLLRAEKANFAVNAAAGLKILKEMEKIYPNDKEMLYCVFR